MTSPRSSLSNVTGTAIERSVTWQTNPDTQPITPYLTVKGASEAIAFYQKAFNATESARMPYEDGKRLMHAAVNINGGTVDALGRVPGVRRAVRRGIGSEPEKPAPVAVAITYATPAEVDATMPAPSRRAARRAAAE